MVRYVTMCVCCELWARYDFSWFEATLECERVPALESWGKLRIGNNNEKGLTSLPGKHQGRIQVTTSHQFIDLWAEV